MKPIKKLKVDMMNTVGAFFGSDIYVAFLKINEIIDALNDLEKKLKK